MTKYAIYVADSANGKTGHVAATYASIAATCPDSCALKNAGCYAQNSRVGMVQARLDRRASPIVAAHAEARAIDAGEVTPLRPMRLHMSGDARVPSAARVLGAAAARYRARRGGPVWTYTHAWRDVPRSSWGPAVSVLASTESIASAPAVRAAGYAPAVVVDSFASLPRRRDANGIKWIPCLEQSRGVQCVECRLCFDDATLRKKSFGIAFEAHGMSKKRVLKVIQ